jgi:hypothetical protein
VTTAKTTAAKKAPAKKAAPAKRTVAKKAPAKKAPAKAAASEERFFLIAVRSGLDAIENTVVSAAEIPLGVLTGFGMSAETAGSARKANRDLAKGIHGTLDTIVTQIADAVAQETALVADVVGKATKQAAKQAAKRPAKKA